MLYDDGPGENCAADPMNAMTEDLFEEYLDLPDLAAGALRRPRWARRDCPTPVHLRRGQPNAQAAEHACDRPRLHLAAPADPRQPLGQGRHQSLGELASTSPDD